MPEWGQSRIEGMIEGRPEWCISSTYLGVPIALFVHKETSELHPNSAELIEKLRKIVEEKGIQAWWDVEPLHCLVRTLKVRKVWIHARRMV